MLLYYKGKVTVDDYEKFCKKNKTSVEKSVFLFPGSQSHHGAKHNLYSVKSGAGLASVAGQLGQRKLPVLSLPTTQMEDWAFNTGTQKTAEDAIADLWRAVGAGYDLVLPVRPYQKKNNIYFSMPLKKKTIEPNFWGGIERTPNKSLGDHYITHLNLLAQFMKCKDTKKKAVFLEKMEKKHPRLVAAYENGEGMKEDDPWRKPPDQLLAAKNQVQDKRASKPISISNSVLRRIIMELLDTFNESDLATEGLFRISANEEEKRSAVQELVRGTITVDSFKDKDPYLKTGIFKDLLRRLRDSGEPALMDPLIANELIAAMDVEGNEKLSKMGHALNKMPAEDKLILAKMLNLFDSVIEHHETTKMNAQNLSIAMAQNWVIYEVKDFQEIARFTNALNKVFKEIIENHEELKHYIEEPKSEEIKKKSEPVSKKSEPVSKKSEPVSKKSEPVSKKVELVGEKPTAVRKKSSDLELFGKIKKLIEEEPWQVGFLGGKSVQFTDGTKITLPHHAAELYELCRKANADNVEQHIEKAYKIIHNRNLPKGFIDKLKHFLKKFDIFNLFSRKESTETFYRKNENLLFNELNKNNRKNTLQSSNKEERTDNKPT